MTASARNHDVATVARFVAMAAARDGRTWWQRLRSISGYAALVLGLVVLQATADRKDLEDRTVASDAVPAGLTDVDGLDVDVVADPVRAVADGDADAAVRWTDGPGSTTALTIWIDPREGASGDARDRILDAVAGLDRPPVTTVRTEMVSPSRALASRDAASNFVLGFGFLAQASMMAATTGFTASASALALEPLLLLPVRRRTLALGTTFGLVPTVAIATVVGCAALMAMLLLPIAGLGVPIGSLPTVGAGVVVAAIGLIPMAAAAAMATSVGSAGRSRSPVELVASFPVLFGGILAANAVVDPPAAYTYLPVVSSATVLGRTVLGELEPVAAVASVASGLAGALVLVRVWAARLDRDAPGRS